MPTLTLSDIEALIIRGSKICQAEFSIEALGEALTAYSQEFDRFQSALLATEAEVLAKMRPQLERLAETHAAVVARAEAARGDLASQLAELRKRGSGMRAYMSGMSGATDRYTWRKG